MFRRRQLYAGLLAMMISLYMLNLLLRPQTFQTTLPGTYQYFRDTDLETPTRLLGAVSHHDARFAPMYSPSVDEVRHVLRDLLDSYVAFMGTINTVSWISHGTLLGWAWNQDLLPWDTDIDTQLSEDALKLLATTYNMTEFVHNGTNSTRRYLLDVNAHYNITSTLDVANKVDARWIDTTTGKFIDITALRSYAQHTRPYLSCKGGHTYVESEIYPLKKSTCAGYSVFVPRQSIKILQKEYGRRALTNRRFHWYRFDTSTKIWLPED